MTDWLEQASQRTAAIVAAMGRASTPPVKDHGRVVEAVPVRWPQTDRWPVLLVGAAPELREAGIELWDAHPNMLEAHAQKPGAFRALVVDARDLSGLWAGALSGASPWKTELIYQALVAWRSAGMPAFLVRSEAESVATWRWSSVSSATFPWRDDDAEETGNPNSPLWRAMMKVGQR